MAATKAGLVLKSVSLQYPAVVSAKSQLAREGSLTGDLVLQFQKCNSMVLSTALSQSDSLLEKVDDSLVEKVDDSLVEKVDQSAFLESIIDTVVVRHRLEKNSFDLIASDVLVEMWEKMCDFECGDIGKRIRKRIL